MHRVLLLLLPTAFLLACADSGPSTETLARWEAQAAAVTITRDDWGIAHVRAKTDAEVVFGMVYAQAEDDFNRIETNYLNAMGRLAEAEGESAIWRDLRMKIFIHPDSMRVRYGSSPDWLKTLMDSWADGLNYYLHTHPEVRPRVLTQFEPWMALTFSEGSIGGDIEGVSLAQLQAFYGKEPKSALAEAAPVGLREPSGSNGFAIAPSKSATGKALLLINPHTSFFFRSELQMTSDEGLNAYGAVTWGQFFIYQGFNEGAGWMHTTSGADVVDEYAETVHQNGERWNYRYGAEERAVITERISIPFKTDTGMAHREFTVYRTHHGPVVREAGGKWITVRLMQEPVKALTQSYSRTKAKEMAAFTETMRLHTNSSNNTVFADSKGNIALFLANHVAKRDPKFDWSRPVDGSDPATEWRGIHTVEESPNTVNPRNGWLQNTNNGPYTAAGADSPRLRDFPNYMDRNGENPRGVHALDVLGRGKAFTLATLIDAAYDPHLTAFDALLPSLFRAYDGLPRTDGQRALLAEPIAELRKWDRRSSVSSVATTLATYWGEDLWLRARADPESESTNLYAFMAAQTAPAVRIASLVAVVEKLQADFGDWRTPWGEVNRFQRLTGDIVQPFADSGASLPVGFASARWGSLASFGARTYPGTKRMYGTSGNSFVAVVEFGDSVRARAVTAGGLNSVPGSKHFNDQAERYATGNLREVYFYPSQLKDHTERTYRPGAK